MSDKTVPVRVTMPMHTADLVAVILGEADAEELLGYPITKQEHEDIENLVSLLKDHLEFSSKEIPPPADFKVEVLASEKGEA